MEQVNFCTGCGHLSPADWESCHDCGNDFDEDNPQSVEATMRYYRAVRAGYGQYPIYGYALVVAAVVAFLATVAVFPTPGDASQVVGAFVLALFAIAFVGVVLILGGISALDPSIFEEDSPPARWKVLGYGVVLVPAVAIALGILSLIPIVNLLAAAGSGLLVLASPYLLYKYRKRLDVDRGTAIATLLAVTGATDDGAESQRGSGSGTTSAIRSNRDDAALTTALALLAAVPPAELTEAERALLAEAVDAAPATVRDVVTTEGFDDAVTNAHRAADESDDVVDRVLDRTLDAGRALRADGESGSAEAVFAAAERVADATDRPAVATTATDLRDAVAADRAAERFAETRDELFDLVRSAERALDAGEDATALERFRTVEDRLGTGVDGDDDLEAAYRDLSERLAAGLAAAARERVTAVLPDAPSAFERRLLEQSLPAPVARRLDDIDAGTLDAAEYAALLEETDLSAVERATASIADYREYQSSVRSVAERPERALRRLDAVVEAALGDDVGQGTGGGLAAAGAYVDALTAVDALERDDPHPALRDCLDAVRSALETRQDLVAASDLRATERLVGRLEPVDVYLDVFPSLSVDVIVAEIADGIREGASPDPTGFDAQFDRIDRLVAAEVDTLANEVESFLTEWRSHPAVDAPGWEEALAEARETGDPVPLVEPYRTVQRMEGTMWTAAELQRFSWEAFERLVANLYDRLGYETTVTAGSKDMGVDVWAERDGERLAIQVKRFAAGNTVGRETIQKLESTLARGDADRVVVVTSSSFARTAARYAAGSPDVELVDGEQLVSLLSRHSVPASGLDG